MARGKALAIARDIVAEVAYAFGAKWDVNAEWSYDDKSDRAEADAQGRPTVVDPTDLDELATEIEELSPDEDRRLLPKGYAATFKVKLGDDWYSVAALTTNEAALIHSLKDALDRLSKKYGDVSTTYSDEDDEEKSGYLIHGVGTYVKKILP